MSFRNGAYAKIWEIQPVTGNFTDIRLSTSHKRKDTGEYEQDFGGFVRLIGTAHQNASKLNVGDRIKLGEVGVTTSYNKETKKQYTNFQCYSFELANDFLQQAETQAKEEKIIETEEDEELPFS